jgi:hypothetical protein
VLEANKFWFYSLVFSILWGVLQLWYGDFGDQSPKGPSGKSFEEIKGQRASNPTDKRARGVVSEERKRVKRRIVSDCFDLLIPGSVVGWISTTSAIVGFATVISTVLSSKDIWDRLQKE